MDIVCFSHLRWNFVYQRPQHLLSRFAHQYRVFYFEEPVYHNRPDSFQVSVNEDDVIVITPQLNDHDQGKSENRQSQVIKEVFLKYNIQNYISWYYTPLALFYTQHLKPRAVVYDCMDELSAFKFASPHIKAAEAELIAKADLVFTGGYSLYEAKKELHHNIHPFPSSIDKKHFSSARKSIPDPPEQQHIPHPRLGFYGVLDERLDTILIQQLAEKRPSWHFIFIGPLAKIEWESLPQRDNIHYLGGKSYKELPAYISSWDIALIPFAQNESTRFISPTKTPEYLAAGKPVISTPIQDVIRFYGENNLVHVAASADGFITAAEQELNVNNRKEWLQNIDSFLTGNSWDVTWKSMNALLNNVLIEKKTLAY